MPVHRQKKCTTTNSSDSTRVQSPLPIPEEQEFRLHLRALARGAIRIVLEGVMREELDALIGVGWGVLPLDMVDKSISPLQTHFVPVFGDEAVRGPSLPRARLPPSPSEGTFIHLPAT